MSDIDDFLMPDNPPDPPPAVDAPVAEAPRSYERKERKAAPSTVPDLTLDTGLPANIDAEKTVLGAILLDGETLKEIKLTIEPDDFSLDSHRRIMLRMAELFGEKRPIDIVTLSSKLTMHKEIEAVGGVAYLASLTEGLPRRPVINEYIRIIKDKSIARQLLIISNLAMQRAMDQSESSLDTLGFVDRELTGLKERARVLAKRGAVEPFFVGYRTFIATAPEDIDWTIDGIIQRDGNGLIIGDSGSSKSVLVFDLTVHMVCGATWFQHIIPRPVKVGLVAREDSPGLSQSRLKRIINGAPESVRMFLDVTDLESALYVNTRAQRETWTLQSEPDIQDIVEAIKEKQIEFVFFDVFRALWEGNENDNQETAKVLAAATRISREGKCQVCIVHHLSKSEKGTIFDRARGGGINGWKEWGMGIEVENPDADPKGQIRKIWFHTKADCAAMPVHYSIHGSEHELRLEQVDAPPIQQNHSKKKKKDGPEQQTMPYKDAAPPPMEDF